MIIILENPQKVLFKHKVSVPRDFIRDIQYLPHYLSGDIEKIWNPHYPRSQKDDFYVLQTTPYVLHTYTFVSISYVYMYVYSAA